MIHELRRKTRPAALLLLGLVLLLASPNTAYCRVDRVNGSDGAEGDPTDGNDVFGGGSGPSDDTLFATGGNDTSRYIPVLVVTSVLPGDRGVPLLIVTPNHLRFLNLRYGNVREGN